MSVEFEFTEKPPLDQILADFYAETPIESLDLDDFLKLPTSPEYEANAAKREIEKAARLQEIAEHNEAVKRNAENCLYGNTKTSDSEMAKLNLPKIYIDVLDNQT